MKTAGCFSADVTANIWNISEEKQRSRPRCLNKSEDFSGRAFPGTTLFNIWPCHGADGRCAAAKLQLHGAPSPRYLATDAHSFVTIRAKRELGLRRETSPFPSLRSGSCPPTQPLHGILIPQCAALGIALLHERFNSGPPPPPSTFILAGTER